MKNKIFISVVTTLAALLVICAAVWFYCANIAPKNAGGQNSVDVSEVFHRVKAEDIQKIKFEGDESYTLLKADGKWQVEGRELKLSADSINKLVSAAATLHTRRDVVRKISKNEKEEFQRQSIRTMTVYGNDELYTLFIGSALEDGDYPVVLDNQKKIYVMSAESARLFIQSLNDLRDRSIHSLDWERLKRSADRYLKSYQVQIPDAPLLSIRAKTNTEMAQTSSKNTYLMQSPYIREVSVDEFNNQVLSKLSTLQIKNFIDSEPEDLSVYGLNEDERTTLQVVTEDITLTLYAGAVKGEERYMQRAGEKEIFTVDKEAASFLDIDPFFLLEASLNIPTPDRVSRMEISVAHGDRYSVTINAAQDGREGTCSINGKSVEFAKFKEWYTSKLMSQKVIGILAASSNETEPYISISLTYATTGNRHTMYFYPVNDMQYAVYINQEHGFSVDKKQMEDALQALRSMSS